MYRRVLPRDPKIVLKSGETIDEDIQKREKSFEGKEGFSNVLIFETNASSSKVASNANEIIRYSTPL
jgi:hypothetical protein